MKTYILSGITRDLILKLASKARLPAKETSISLDDLFAADKIWVTGSSKEIFPIIKLDEKKVGDGKVGPIWHKIVQMYEDIKLKPRQKEKVFGGAASLL